MNQWCIIHDAKNLYFIDKMASFRVLQFNPVNPTLSSPTARVNVEEAICVDNTRYTYLSITLTPTGFAALFSSQLRKYTLLKNDQEVCFPIKNCPFQFCFTCNHPFPSHPGSWFFTVAIELESFERKKSLYV